MRTLFKKLVTRHVWMLCYLQLECFVICMNNTAIRTINTIKTITMPAISYFI